MKQDRDDLTGALNGLLNIVLFIPLLFFILIKAFLSGSGYKK